MPSKARPRPPISLSILLLAALSAAFPAHVLAQPMGKTVVLPLGAPDAKAALSAADALEAALAARRVPMVSMHDARDRFKARSRQPLTATTSDLDVLAREARQALEHVAFGRTAAAQRSVREVMARAERTLESLNRETARARQLLDACLSLVRSALHENNREQALEQAMACRRLVPDLAPSEAVHPANVVGVLAEADDLLRRMRVGKLSLNSQPQPSCSVFLNGRHLGSTPFVLDRAASGEYRVQVECVPAPAGRVHVVQLGDDPVSMLVDTDFDRAIGSEPRLHLDYASDAILHESVASHAALLGHEVRVEDVVLVHVAAGRAELIRVRVGQGRAVARTYLPYDARRGFGAELPGALSALFEGRVEPGPSLEPARALPAAAAPVAQASAPAQTADAPAPPSDEPTTPAPSWPARRSRSGYVLAGLAGAVFATGLALELRARSLRNGVAPPQGEEGFLAADYLKAEDLLQASWLGVASGPLGLAAVLLATAPRESVPWWGYLAGAGGLALLGGGIYDLAMADKCALKDHEEQTCLYTRDTTARGAMLLSAAAPLIALPVTQLVRRRRASPALAWNLRSAPDRVMLILRGSY
jgi:hypothetical protein